MRVNFIAGPGAGKSTTVARVFSELKELKYSIEHVTEYVKSWTYIKRGVKEFDQIYIFAKQQQAEYKFLSNGVKNVITDSPTFLSVFYSKMYISQEMSDAIWKLCELYDAKYPVYNIFLERGNKTYDSNGRYQTEDEAREMDNIMWNQLISYYSPEQCSKIPFFNKEEILQKVLDIIDK